MKFVNGRLLADPDVAARKLVELANAVEAAQDGRIHIEKINGPMLFQLKATPAEYKAGLDRAIANGWLVLHESGTFVKFTQAGARSVRLSRYAGSPDAIPSIARSQAISSKIMPRLIISASRSATCVIQAPVSLTLKRDSSPCSSAASSAANAPRTASYIMVRLSFVNAK